MHFGKPHVLSNLIQVDAWESRGFSYTFPFLSTENVLKKKGSFKVSRVSRFWVKCFRTNLTRSWKEQRNQEIKTREERHS